MDWAEEHVAPHTFGLNDLAAISGVPVPTIQSWQWRGAVRVRRPGKGRPRRYTVWDALELAAIAELSRLCVRPSRSGPDLATALVGLVRYHVALDAELVSLPDVVLLFPCQDGGWEMSAADSSEKPKGSHLACDIRIVATEIAERFGQKMTV